MLKYYSILAVLLVCIILCSGCVKSPPAYEVVEGPYEKIQITGETAKTGVYDLSLEYGQDGTGWMAYSAIETEGCVYTNLAKTSNHGETWRYIKRINECEIGAVTLPNGSQVDGVWRNEVPTLVYDPEDPGREWKLYYHRYFVRPPYISSDRMFQFGWISYKYAAIPDGEWSEEIPLFGGFYPQPPYKVRQKLNELSPDLAGMLTYSEMGSLVFDGILYLSIQGVSGTGTKPGDFKTFLISSSDHGETWEYLGTLTDYQDAVQLGAGILTASSLALEDGKAFLLMAPTQNLFPRKGTYVFEFEDISEARLKRDRNGKLAVHKYFKPSLAGIGDAGESDYDGQNTYGGMIMSQVDLSDYPDSVLEIFSTREKIA